ncbi:MAG: hypothetical protein V2I46_01095 [Bacteroides sp.]|jgi:hypothetical protein|nr:hypothetical protein [Bacteroides sp.]
MNKIKDRWNNINEFSGIPGYGLTSIEKFIQGRSESIFEKIRSIFLRDIIIKSIAAVFITLNLIFYQGYDLIITLNVVLLAFLGFFFFIEMKYFSAFKRSADMGKSSKENLSSILIFLERKFPVSAIFRATTYLFGFVPGLLLYFYLAYGYPKPIETMGYFVFSFLCLLGIISGYILDTRQVRHHKNHIKVCLSDLNDDALALASANIEANRKLDITTIVLVQALILLGFLVLVVILKSALT